MIVVGLTGYSRVGKDSVANVLVAKHSFERLTFAAALKDILRQQDPILGYGKFASGPRHELRLSELIEAGWSEDEIKGSDFGPEYVRLLQKLGTEGIRKYDPWFWISIVEQVLEAGTDTDKRYVLTDARFPNEAGMMDPRTPADLGELWQVKRPGTEPEAGRPLHASELCVGRMGEHHIIDNDGTLKDLEAKVDALVLPLLAAATIKKEQLDPK